MALRQRGRGRQRHVGELLPVRALGEDGLLVRSDGALVRFIEVIPGNPLVLDAAGCERMTRGFTDLLLAVPAGMSVQMYAQGAHIALEELLQAARRETDTATAALLHSPDPALRARGQALRALAEIHEESLATHAEQQAALQVRFVLVVPFLPEIAARDPTRPTVRAHTKPTSPPRTLERQPSLTRDSLAFAEQLRGALSALDVRATLMTGPQVADLLWQRLAPQTARTLPHQRPSRIPTTSVSVLGQPGDDRALQHAVFQGAVDLSDPRRVVVDGDLEHTFYVSGRPERTFYGWLLHAMQSTKPWTLSVHVRLRDRVEMRAAYQRQERRIAGVNQGAHDTGRRPDRDQLRQESELQSLVDHDLATGAESVCDISIYQSIREPAPDPDPHELDIDAVAAMRALGGAVDAPINRGELQQADLWRSTLPLGLDFASRTFRAVTRNAADCTPFVSTRCGSPDGLPLGFAAPGRTLERLQPFDPVHDNAVTLVFAKSGGGKTATVISLLTAALPRGAQVTVLDRSRGHYAFPCQLLPGAAHLEPAADLPHAPVINPWDTPDPTTVPKRKIAFLVRLHALLIGDHDAATDHYGLTPLQRALLAAAIRDVYTRAARHATTPSESALRDVLLDHAKREATATMAPPRSSPPCAASRGRSRSSAPTAPTARCWTAPPPSPRTTPRCSSSTPTVSPTTSTPPSSSSRWSTPSAASRRASNATSPPSPPATRPPDRSTAPRSSCSRKSGSSCATAPPANGSSNKPNAPATSACG